MSDGGVLVGKNGDVKIYAVHVRDQVGDTDLRLVQTEDGNFGLRYEARGWPRGPHLVGMPGWNLETPRHRVTYQGIYADGVRFNVESKETYDLSAETNRKERELLARDKQASAERAAQAARKAEEDRVTRICERYADLQLRLSPDDNEILTEFTDWLRNEVYAQGRDGA